MSSGKPPVAVKPTNIQLNPKSHPLIADTKPSVAEFKKKLATILTKFPDAPKNEVTLNKFPDAPKNEVTLNKFPDAPKNAVTLNKFPDAPKNEVTLNKFPDAPKNEATLNKFPDAPRNEATRTHSVDIQLPARPASHQAGPGGPTRSCTVRNGQGKNKTINGIELCRLNFDRRATVPNETIRPSDSVEKEANQKNAREIAKTMDRDSQNSEHTNGHSKKDTDADVWVYSPVSMLMKQILDSVEMPVVQFNALPETELVHLLSLYNEDIDKARIHCISQWNDTVNELLESTGYSTSDFYRNIASLIFCKVDLDFKAASKCLGNDRVKMIITRRVSRLEERSQQANLTVFHRQGNKSSAMNNPDIWKAIVEDVMAAYGWENYLECTIEQKCQICWETVPSDEIFGLFMCQCVVCNSCIKRYFEVMIHDGYVANFVCPVCHLPDVEDTSIHFQLLEPKLKRLLSAEDFVAYQRKLTEWNLVRNPNFLWCINVACHSGFLIEENGYSRVCCPECSMEMCHRCKRPWEDQHVGVTCEEFKDWKKSNDPEFQEDALRQQLQENGIDCPGCRRRYLLSKGGCIHFTCTFCHYEFCSSCSRRFVRSCERANHCEQSGGLHCHHPRNCLYYLRDRGVDELQTLLESNNVSYEKSQQTHITTCPVVEEQDADTGGFTRELCKARSLLPGHDGFCEKHYKEYLAGIIQRSRIDPSAIMSQFELTRELQSHGITDIPTQLQTETKNQYLCRLRKLVMAKVMLPRQDRRWNDQLQ